MVRIFFTPGVYFKKRFPGQKKMNDHKLVEDLVTQNKKLERRLKQMMEEKKQNEGLAARLAKMERLMCEAAAKDEENEKLKKKLQLLEKATSNPAASHADDASPTESPRRRSPRLRRASYPRTKPAKPKPAARHSYASPSESPRRSPRVAAIAKATSSRMVRRLSFGSGVRPTGRGGGKAKKKVTKPGSPDGS